MKESVLLLEHELEVLERTSDVIHALAPLVAEHVEYNCHEEDGRFNPREAGAMLDAIEMLSREAVVIFEDISSRRKRAESAGNIN